MVFCEGLGLEGIRKVETSEEFAQLGETAVVVLVDEG